MRNGSQKSDEGLRKKNDKKDENSEEENTCQNALEHRTRKSSAA